MEDKYKTERQQAYNEIQQPRTPHVLGAMVVNSKFTDEQRYAQCVLEMSIAEDNLRTATANKEKCELRIDSKIRRIDRHKSLLKEAQKRKPQVMITLDLEDEDGKIYEKKMDLPDAEAHIRIEELDLNIKQVELEQLQRAMLGASREFAFLNNMWMNWGKRYTREDLNNAQEEEYKQRLITQAQHDIEATGRISAGNLEGLRQIGYPEVHPLFIAPETERKFLSPEENENLKLVQELNEETRKILPPIDEVSAKFLNEGKNKIFIAVPTEKAAIDKDKKPYLPCLNGLKIPTNIAYQKHNAFGRPVADNYNDIVIKALQENADYLITIEDDTFPPSDAIEKLVKLANEWNFVNPTTTYPLNYAPTLCAFGAWYTKKEHPRTGVHIIMNKDGKREFLNTDDGKIYECYTLAMGCSIYPMDMFKKISPPWFVTTPQLSQDSYFSQKARDAGFKLYCDTSIKCKHIAKDGEVFE